MVGGMELRARKLAWDGMGSREAGCCRAKYGNHDPGKARVHGYWPVDLPSAAPWVASPTHLSPANQRGTLFVGWGRGTAKLLGIR